jgi:hypothetical protein
MDRILWQLWRTPARLSPTQVRNISGLAIIILMLAALGFWVYDGAQRVAHVAALGLVSFSNIVWVIGSILPEDGGGRRLRDAVRPLTIQMLIALVVALTFR